MDLASLGIKIEAQGIDQAAQSLDKLTRAGDGAEQAAESVGKAWSDAGRSASDGARTIAETAEQASQRYRDIAQRATEFAEAQKVANESQRSLAERAREAAAGLDQQKQATTDWAAEQARANARGAEILATERRLAQQQRASTAATTARRSELQKLLGQIDPTVAKLEALAQMEERLGQFGDQGLIKPQVLEQYQTKIDGMRQKVLQAGQAMQEGGKSAGEMAGKLGKLNLGAVETQQSVASLVRSLATGQWGQAQASITSLTARTGGLSAVFSLAGLAITGAAASAAYFAKQVFDGYQESRKLEGALLATGNAAGVAGGEVSDLTRSIGAQTGRYREAADAARDLLLSGKATGETFETIMRSSANLATLTGQSIQQASQDVASLATGGADALHRLNQRYNFLTFEVYEHVRSLREQGREQDAVKASMEALERVSEDRATKMREQAGWVERAWRGVKGALAEVRESIADIGRTDTAARIRVAERTLAEAEGPLQGWNPLYNRTRERLRSEIQKLRAEQEREAAEADREAAKSAADAAVVDLDAELRRYESREQQKRREIARIKGETAKAVEQIEKAGGAQQAEMIRRVRDNEAKILAGIEERYKPRANGARGLERSGIQEQLQAFRDALAVEQGAIANSTAILEAQYRARLITTEDYYARQRELVIQNADAEEDALLGQIEVLKQRNATGKDAIDTQRQLGQLEAQLAKQRADSATKLFVLGIQEKAQAEQKAQAISAYANALERANDALSRQMDTAVARIGMGQREFEIQSRINDVYAEQADRLRELAQQLAGGKIEEDVYASQVEIVKKATDERVRIITDGYDRIAAAEGNWANGANKAIADYLENARNIAGQVEEVWGNAFRGLEDLAVDFFTKGTADWRGFLDQVNADIMRFIIRQQLSKWLDSLGQSMSGGGGAGGGWVSFLGALFGGSRGDGGAAHKGRIYNVSERGAPEVFEMKGRSYLIPPAGGVVRPMRESSVAHQRGTGSSHFTFNVNGSIDNRSAYRIALDTNQKQRLAAARA